VVVKTEAKFTINLEPADILVMRLTFVARIRETVREDRLGSNLSTSVIGVLGASTPKVNNSFVVNISAVYHSPGIDSWRSQKSISGSFSHFLSETRGHHGKQAEFYSVIFDRVGET
jgi:hypothetical protein